MKVAALQTAFTDNVAANVRRVTELVREAAGKGAQVVLPSELFEGVYFCLRHGVAASEVVRWKQEDVINTGFFTRL